VPELEAILPALRSAAAGWEVVDLRNLSQARESDAAAVATVSATDIPGTVSGPVAVEEASLAAGPTRSITKVRIYRSRQGAGTPGALLFFHGGAFCLGDLETDHLRCLAYAQRTGTTVISVDYPLAPEHPYPAAFDACLAAAEWVHANSRDLTIDPTRIGVGGESAGGALAAGVALALRDRARIELQCQLLLFPALDYRQTTPSMRRYGDSPAWNSVQTAHMWRLYLGTEPTHFAQSLAEGVAHYAAPGVGHDLAGLPPALIITAEVDPLRDEGLDYATRLLHAGVPVELHNYAGTFHVFDFAAPLADVSVRALDEQVSFIRRHLGPPTQR
jgi:acetyl esterase